VRVLDEFGVERILLARHVQWIYRSLDWPGWFGFRWRLWFWALITYTGHVDSAEAEKNYFEHSLRTLGKLIRRKPKTIINYVFVGALHLLCQICPLIGVKFCFWNVFGNLRISVRFWELQAFLGFERFAWQCDRLIQARHGKISPKYNVNNHWKTVLGGYGYLEHPIYCLCCWWCAPKNSPFRTFWKIKNPPIYTSLKSEKNCRFWTPQFLNCLFKPTKEVFGGFVLVFFWVQFSGHFQIVAVWLFHFFLIFFPKNGLRWFQVITESKRIWK
jgi:hypothetical protein